MYSVVLTATVNLIHEIHKGKNIKKNLLLYRDRVVQTYCEYGVLDLTFGAYTFMEQIVEEQAERAQKDGDLTDKTTDSVLHNALVFTLRQKFFHLQ